MKQYKKNLDKFNLLILTLLSSCAFFIGNWRNGYAYSYYSAATQSATNSWKSFFYGSFDASNYMSIDKPPMAVWISSIFTRIFGFNSFWILFPHALAGVLCALVLYAIIRKHFDSRTALLAGLFFIITPVSAVVFRYNLTDSFLTLFLLASIYYFLCALENSKFKYLIFSGIFIGFAFNTKMTQGIIIVPIFIIFYYFESERKILLKLKDLLVFCGTVLISSLWWEVIVWLTPVSQRPFVGSTKNNSIWELVFIHNGFGRFFGSHWKQPTGSTTGIAFGGNIGVLRIFNKGFGPNIAWLLLPAILGAVFYLWFHQKDNKKDQSLTLVKFWLSFLLLHLVVFSITKGTIHPYYVVVLAPASAVLSAIFLSILWSKTISPKVAYKMNKYLLIIPGITIFVFAPLYLFNGPTWSKATGIISIAIGIISLLGYGLSSFAKDSISIKFNIYLSWSALLIIPCILSIATIFSVQYGFVPTTQPIPEAISKLRKPNLIIPNDVKEFLLKNSGDTKWVAITSSSISASPIQLSTLRPVIAIGGFSAEDNSMSISELKTLVQKGEVRYFVLDLSQSSGGEICPDKINTSQLIENQNTIISKCSKPVNEYMKSTSNIVAWAQDQKPVLEFMGANSDYRIFDLANK